MKRHKIMVPVYMTERESMEWPMLCAAAGFGSPEELRRYLNGRKEYNEQPGSSTVSKSYQFVAGALVIRPLKRAFMQFKAAYPELLFNIEDDGGFIERTFMVTAAGFPPDMERFDRAMHLWMVRIRRTLDND
jgi:hypothetical protein